VIERFHPGQRAVRDDRSGRIFTGITHQKARDRMERVMGRRQPSTEGYQTPDGFVPKSEMHNR
jgi:hypothetical protein